MTKLFSLQILFIRIHTLLPFFESLNDLWIVIGFFCLYWNILGSYGLQAFIVQA